MRQILLRCDDINGIIAAKGAAIIHFNAQRLAPIGATAVNAQLYHKQRTCLWYNCRKGRGYYSYAQRLAPIGATAVNARLYHIRFATMV
jgi:hypothetical protein